MSTNQSKRKESQFLEVLGTNHIDLKNLRSLSTSGIVDSCGIRPICWRIFLNVLPNIRSDWQDVLEKQRQQYADFLHEMIIKPGLKRSDAVIDDHPLNPNPSSEWNSFFKDNNVLLQIDKDVRRLCPDIGFFQCATDFPCIEIVEPGSQLENLRKRVERTALSSENVTKDRSGVTNLINIRKKATREYDIIVEEGKEAHWEVVERILFIYAKLNPGTGYVQGMNEIVGPLYFTLASDPNVEWKRYAEADAFFCFTNLMGEIRDHFIKSMDDSASGIGHSMNQVVLIIKQCDPELHSLLLKQKIYPQYYLFRWITLLLSQEFLLADVIFMWDVLFADRDRFQFLLFVCAAMVILLRDDLLTHDFSHNIKLLQNYPHHIIELGRIFDKARELQRPKYRAI